MASTYSTNLRIELMVDGENSNTWGGKTNTSLNLLEQAVSGVASVAMTDADYTLTTSNAATDEARNAVITMTGTLTQARNVIVPSVDKVYIFKNSTTGGFSIIVKTSAGTGVTVPNGETAQVYCDATNVVLAETGGATTAILVGGGVGGLPVWTAATGSGAPVRATSPTLVTPVLGTPASGTLTNCTGLPAAGVTGLGTLATQNGTFSGNSSGTNTGDNATNSQYSGLVSNATHTGDVTGATSLTIANDAVTYAKMQNVSATDKLLGRSTAGSGDVEEIACTAAGRAILDDANATAQRATLGLVIGTNVQAYDAELAALAGLTSAANKVPMFSGSGTAMLIDFKDEDNMASDSATAVPSQQSVKAYVDAAASGGITIGTQQAATSGTSITFGSIPAGTKRITVMFDEVSTNSNGAQLILRIGDSGGLETAGYATSSGTAAPTDGFALTDYGSAADKRSGSVVLDLMNAATFKWVMRGSIAIVNIPQSQAAGGVKSLSAELTQLSITTSAGTATFDNGNINISYE